MRQLIWILASIFSLAPAVTAHAQDWRALDGAAITSALNARILAYKDGATQQFNADGTTLSIAEKPSVGDWRIEADQYCSVWPPSDLWSCFDVAQSADGLDLRFTSGDGSESVGRYIDLK